MKRYFALLCGLLMFFSAQAENLDTEVDVVGLTIEMARRLDQRAENSAYLETMQLPETQLELVRSFGAGNHDLPSGICQARDPAVTDMVMTFLPIGESGPEVERMQATLREFQPMTILAGQHSVDLLAAVNVLTERISLPAGSLTGSGYVVLTYPDAATFTSSWAVDNGVLTMTGMFLGEVFAQCQSSVDLALKGATLGLGLEVAELTENTPYPEKPAQEGILSEQVRARASRLVQMLPKTAEPMMNLYAAEEGLQNLARELAQVVFGEEPCESWLSHAGQASIGYQEIINAFAATQGINQLAMSTATALEDHFLDEEAQGNGVLFFRSEKNELAAAVWTAQAGTVSMKALYLGEVPGLFQ